MRILESRYQVQVAPQTTTRTGYLAGSDDQRADAFNQLAADPDVRAIVLARGGYGITRILDRLDADALRRDPKLIVGYSDATALLCWALERAHLRCVHGPMVSQLEQLPEGDIAWLFQLMENPQPAGAVTGPLAAQLAPIGAHLPTSGVVGTLVGGNLCLLAHLLGTPYQLTGTDLILLLEDVGQRPYRLDRYMSHLGMAGLLGRAVGALLGEFTRCLETVRTGHPTAAEVLEERLQHYRIPAMSGAPLAHGARNLALPLGARCRLDGDGQTVHLLESAVA